MRRLIRERRGNAGLEFALVAPALFLLLFGITEFGRTMWLQNALDYSVAEAARCASIDTTSCGTAAQIQSYAANTSGGDFTSSTFTASTPSCGNEVSASYPMTLMIPFVSLSVTLTAQACFPS